MATSSTPTRIDHELYESARLVADTQSRTTAQQIAHWARIGREVEASRSLTHDAIRALLANATRYDDLSPEAQALVRSRWIAIGDELRAGLDLRREFTEQGRSFAELDDDGNVIWVDGSE